MLDFTAVEKNHELANRFAETFRKQTKKKAAKALFMGVSPLALAACGGGSESSTAQSLISGTDGDDTFTNSSENERFEGGLGDDFYEIDIDDGNDEIFDSGGIDTLRLVARDADDNARSKEIYTDEDDLIVEMVDGGSVRIEGAFSDSGRIEIINQYHAGGDWGENANGSLSKISESVAVDDGFIVGSMLDDVYLTTSDQNDGTVILGAGGDDSITAAGGTQFIYGGPGDDTVDGGADDDTIYGNDGDDLLRGGSGNDVVEGGSGNDTLVADGGADVFDGGAGNDTLLEDMSGVTDFSKELYFNLSTGKHGVVGKTTGVDDLISLENYTINAAFNVIVTGNEDANVFISNWGADEVYGNGGDDIIEGNGGDDVLYGGSGNDEIDGGDGNDTIEGNGGDDILSGGGGDDQLDGGAGNDAFWLSLGTDHYIGGDGVDTFNIEGEADEQFPDNLSITVSFSDGVGSITDGPTVLTFSEVENFRAGYDFDDAYIGSTWSYIITGSEVSHTFETAEGSDTINGGDGNDTIISNGGNDVLDGGAGDDHVYAGDGNDIVYGSPGTDIEDGGDGIDTLIYGDWLGNWSGTFNLATGENFVSGGSPSAGHQMINFENIRTEHSGDMTIIGTDGDNIIETGAGNDTIRGGDGADIIYAGDGNDTIDAGAGDDFIVASRGADFEDGGDGSDTMMWYDPEVTSVTIDLSIQGGGLNGGEFTSGLFASIENVKAGYNYKTFEYVGNDTIWTIIGSSDANTIETSEADDRLEGGHGSDTLIGNGGADTFVFKIGETGTDIIADFDLAEGDKLDLTSYGITTEEAAEALMSDGSDGVDVSIDGNVIVTMTTTTVADFAAADGWLA